MSVTSHDVVPSLFAASYHELYPSATDEVVALMWHGDAGHMWRKSRIDALECAALICVSLVPKYERFDDQRGAGNKARECASEIRKFAESDPKQS